MPFGFLGVDSFLPPTSLAVAALLALVLLRRSARTVATLLLILLVMLAMPLVAGPLIAALDVPAGSVPPDGAAPGAIVILSADVDRTATGSDLGSMTLERERAGAALARRTGLPVLVTGGLVTQPPPVGQMMAASMPADFGVPVRWTEDRSRTTWENAEFSVPILKAAGVNRIYLVTHDWHMRRALVAFHYAGMDAVPIPVRVDPAPRWELGGLVPRASAWESSFLAIHEWVGLLFYELRVYESRD